MPAWVWVLIAGGTVSAIGVIAVGGYFVMRSLRPETSTAVIAQTQPAESAPSTPPPASTPTPAPVSATPSTSPAAKPAPPPVQQATPTAPAIETPAPAAPSGNPVAGISSLFGPTPNAARNGTSSARPNSRNPSAQPATQSPTASPASVPALPAESVASIVEKVSGGIVQIKTRNSAGKDLGMGSGFLIDKSGVVVTNFHVIRQASSASASFRDGKSIDVKGCLAWSRELDLAVLRLASVPDQHQVLKLCSDTNRASGAQVVAIGHPEGFKYTTTTGILSAVQLTREIPAQFRVQLEAPEDATWLQTSAVALPGSSGGPLLNSQSEVIGINTWIIPKTGFTFSIDVRHLREILQKVPSLTSGPLTLLASLTGPEETLSLLQEDYLTRLGYFQVRLLQATTPAQQKSLVTKTHPAISLMPKFMDLAEKYPQSPAAFQALVFVCSQADFEGAPPACSKLFTKAGDQLLKTYLDSPKLAAAIWLLRDARSPATRKFLKRITTESKLDKNQALAELAAAMSLSEGNDSEVKEALRLLDHAAQTFKNVQFGGYTIGQLAEAMGYEMRYLAVGRIPPDISGKDQNGADFKLSDFRGKVVVVDFFVDWCPHCVKMYPAEREMVTRYQGKPFALVGVNCDEGDRLKDIVSEKTVTWRCWADGSGGPISQSWRVESFPTLYVLDHTGKIRYKNLRGEDLEAAVAQLMAQVPGGGSGGGSKPKTRGRR